MTSVTSPPTVAIVGGGFSGVAAAIALQQVGISTYTVFEKGDGVGGTWRENTYPGAACDVPSYLYSFSYAQRRHWSRPCSPQAEILDYLTEVAHDYGVDTRLRSNVEVTAADFDAATLRWTLTLATGETHEADLLVMACGQLSRPHIPELPGADGFPGPAFHSARWDHDVDLAGKRVAVVGTGASAVQFVPAVVEQAAHVDVYQRTPQWMLPRRNEAYGPGVVTLLGLFPWLQKLRRLGMLAFMESSIHGLTDQPWRMVGTRLWARWFLRRQVPDPALRAKLTPDYPIGCKRILFTSHYLPALAQPHVELVTSPVKGFEGADVLDGDGVRRSADVVIYGTGFRSQDFVAPVTVTGRSGRTLDETWAAGAHAHLGMTVPDFPGMFLMYGPNTNLGIGSILVMVEAQAGYIADAASRWRPGTSLAVKSLVAHRFDVTTQQRLATSAWATCDSWYTQADGRVVNNWPGTMREYVIATRQLDPVEYEVLRAG